MSRNAFVQVQSERLYLQSNFPPFFELRPRPEVPLTTFVSQQFHEFHNTLPVSVVRQLVILLNISQPRSR